MLRIVKNTFPEYPGVAHGEPGDVVEWRQRDTNTKSIVRLLDGKGIMSESRNSRTGKFEWPPIGIVCQNKSRGWVLILEQVNE